MSHSESEKKESDSQDKEEKDSGENKPNKPPIQPPRGIPPITTNRPVSAPKGGVDPRFSRLAKMQSEYVTEEAIRSTEELSKPKAPPPGAEDEDFPVDEDYEDEEFDDEEYPEDEDFEDDEYEDEELRKPRSRKSKEKKDEEPEPEPEDDSDHRVAQLRKLRKQFVKKEDLDLKPGSGEQQVFAEAEVAIVICPNCQSEEPRTQKMCGECGAKLPNITAIQEEKYNPGTLNQAVMKYVNGVKNLKNGEWDADQFRDFLDQRRQLVEEQVDGLYELLEECGSEEWLPDATKLIYESTQVLEESISTMLVKVDETEQLQATLEMEYDELLEACAEDEEAEPPDPPLTMDERIRGVDFTPEIDEIKRANGMMLETLKLIDKFQKKAHEDLEVSM